MSLLTLYAPTEVTLVLGLTSNESYKKYDAGLLFNPVTDVVDNDNVESGASTIATLIKDGEKDDSNLPMIFPLIEKQKILGLIPRNHWVTLHYDPNTKIATLIDSRPWLVSLLYPLSSMKQSLKKAGLEFTQWKTIYQGVQYNDVHCGAWTCSNALALATGSATVDELQNRFSVIDEKRIVQHNKFLVDFNTRIPSIDPIYVPLAKNWRLSLRVFFLDIIRSIKDAGVSLGRKLGLVRTENVVTAIVPDCNFNSDSDSDSDDEANHSSTNIINNSVGAKTPVISNATDPVIIAGPLGKNDTGEDNMKTIPNRSPLTASV